MQRLKNQNMINIRNLSIKYNTNKRLFRNKNQGKGFKLTTTVIMVTEVRNIKVPSKNSPM